MDEARKLPEGWVYTADEIWDLPDADSIDWRCLGCPAKLKPWAWRKETVYKQRAHFKARRGHKDGCRVDGLDELLEKAGRQPIETSEGLTSTIPNHVSFPVKRLIIDAPGKTGSIDETKKTYFKDPAIDPDLPPAPYHGRWARSLYTVCRAHAHMTVEVRRKFPLCVEGCEGETYIEVFDPFYDLDVDEPVPKFHSKVLYGALLFKQSPDYRSELGPEIKLLNGRKQAGSTWNVLSYRVRVDWTSWTRQQRESFKKQFEEQKSQLEEDYRTAQQKNKPRPSAKLYFVGKQNEQDKMLFEVNDSRKLCMVYPVLPDNVTHERVLIYQRRLERSKELAYKKPGPLKSEMSQQPETYARQVVVESESVDTSRVQQQPMISEKVQTEVPSSLTVKAEIKEEEATDKRVIKPTSKKLPASELQGLKNLPTFVVPATKKSALGFIKRVFNKAFR